MISCTRSVKERQKLVSELCITQEHNRMHKASMRESEIFEQTVHRQEQNRMCVASMRESAAPRVWHFSAFHSGIVSPVSTVFPPRH